MSASLCALALLVLTNPGAEVQTATTAAAQTAYTDGTQAVDPAATVAVDPASTEAANTAATETATVGFIKGEFAHAGVIRLVPQRSFIGARVGALIQDDTIYLSVGPKADLRFLDGELRLGLEVPINIEMYSLQNAADSGTGGGGFDNAGRLRKGDYDEGRDFVKFLRYLTYGKKEDNLFVNIGQLYAATLGHGQIMRRYAGNVDINQTRVGLEVDAYGDYGGFEFFLADVTRGNVFGALGFIKPLSFFSENPMARSLSLGVSWATDQKAPYELARMTPVGTATLGAVLSAGDGSPLNPPLTNTRAVNIFGVDAEFKVLRTDDVDLKTYADFSTLQGSGSGFTLGVLGRFNFHVGSSVHLLRTRLELRTYDANFLPSYFDTLYEFQKYQFTPNLAAFGPDYTTKLRAIRERTGPRRYGLYAEATYAIPGWFVLAAAFETETEGQDQHLMLHAEIPWKYLQLFATYHQRNLDKPFTLNQNDLIYAGGRLKILPILFLNGRVQKTFAWDPSAFDDLGAYGDDLNFQVDVEFGFEI